MKPDLKQLKDGVHKLNMFGKGEHSGAAIGSEGNNNKDVEVELNTTYIQWEDAKDEDDEWCHVCYDEEEKEGHGNKLVVLDVEVNNDVAQGNKHALEQYE